MTRKAASSIEPMLSSKTISSVLDVPMKTLRRAIESGRFPRPDLKFGIQYRWKQSTVEEFVKNAKP